MITITALFLFFFVFLGLLGIGIAGRSAVWVLCASGLLILVSLYGLADGVQEYDGSYNSSYTYHNSSNVSINAITRVANYTVKTHTDSNTLAALGVLVLVGMAGVAYAGFMVMSPKKETALQGEVDWQD